MKPAVIAIGSALICAAAHSRILGQDTLPDDMASISARQIISTLKDETSSPPKVGAIGKASVAPTTDDLQFVRHEKNASLWLKGPSCGILNKQAQALRLWASKLGEPAKTDPPTCLSAEDGQYIISMEQAPSEAKRLHGKHVKTSLANCYATAFYLNKIMPALRMVSTEERDFILFESPLCRKIEQDQLQPGDIIYFPGLEGDHILTHITCELSFEKASWWPSEPFQFNSARKIFGEHGIPLGCCFKKDKNCPRGTHIRYFHCDSLDKYLQQNAVPANKRYQLFNKKISALEKEIADAFMTSDSEDLPFQWRRQKMKTVKKAQAELNTVSMSSGNEEQQFLWKLLDYRIKGLKLLIEENSGLDSDGEIDQ